jgi:RNA polymerase sigma-70 factor (ECF subfamily)
VQDPFEKPTPNSATMIVIEPIIPGLRRYARSFVRDRSSVDDLVQDCLERAISRWHQRRADKDLRGWLFTILHNLAINRIRQQKRRGLHVAMQDVNPEVFGYTPAPDESLQHDEFMRAFEALPEAQRSVLLLISVESLSYAEASRVLDVPIGTVMSRLARGREQLRVALEGQLKQDDPATVQRILDDDR